MINLSWGGQSVNGKQRSRHAGRASGEVTKLKTKANQTKTEGGKRRGGFGKKTWCCSAEKKGEKKNTAVRAKERGRRVLGLIITRARTRGEGGIGIGKEGAFVKQTWAGKQSWGPSELTEVRRWLGVGERGKGHVNGAVGGPFSALRRGSAPAGG